MCGIVGIVDADAPVAGRRRLVERMADRLIHRGPDGEAFAGGSSCDLGLRRLAIVDLASTAQIFADEAGVVRSCCNGEIYNAARLRSDLREKGHVFATGVDTEVLPHLYEEHGPGLVERLNGMFAFAVWDERRQTLVLGRDRAGEKSLFYWCDGGTIVFASELSALLVHPAISRRLDPVALRRYLLHDYFPAPLTPIAGVRKLGPGEVLVHRDGTATVRSYWDLAEALRSSSGRRVSIPAAVEELDQRLELAVRRRCRTDAPFGIFLSGGIDSATVLAYATRIHGRGLPVFSIGHRDRSFDEARFAAETARHFGAEYHPLILEESDLRRGLLEVGRGFSEPLGDASSIPTHLLALEARRRVKVILSGEGADELFGGYPTYLGHRFADSYGRLPAFLRRSLIGGARRLAPVSMGNVGADYLLERFASASERELIERHHVWFGSISPERQSSILSDGVRARLIGDDAFAAARTRDERAAIPDRLGRLLYQDFTLYLAEGLLTKVDRACMLASLEPRAPFLDHELTDYVAALPGSLKLRGTTTKWILRRTVRDQLPPAVLGRRKRGFNIPFSRWLLSGLGEELRERFSTERVEARGLLSAAGVGALLDEHLDRQADHRKPLYSLLALDLWCDSVFGVGAPVPLADSG